MLKLRCSCDTLRSCENKFNSSVCSLCEYNVYMCEHSDASLYEVNIFSVKKSTFTSAIGKVEFLIDFVSLLSKKYGSINLIDYSFKEDISNKDYYVFRVITSKS